MAEHDYNVANADGATVRSDINSMASAIVSNNSKSTAPSTTFAYMFWADTTAGLIKQRNAANSAWVTVGVMASTNWGLLALAGGTMSGSLTHDTASQCLLDDSVTAAGASLPLAFDGDGDTGFYRPAANTLAAATGATEAFRIDSSQNLLLGSTALISGERLHVKSTASGFLQALYATHATYASTALLMRATRANNAAYSFANWQSGDGADVEFNFKGDGNALCDGSFTGGGADYAEFFEWADGNPTAEDRRGLAVVLAGRKVRPATGADHPADVIGVVSAHPTVVGDAAWNKWDGKYLRDEFGSYRRDESGGRYLNPAYDPAVPYTPRWERPEWDCVGLMGKLRLRAGQPTGERWRKLRDTSPAVEEWLVR
jgi:hypothetical protein